MWCTDDHLPEVAIFRTPHVSFPNSSVARQQCISVGKMHWTSFYQKDPGIRATLGRQSLIRHMCLVLPLNKEMALDSFLFGTEGILVCFFSSTQ